MVLTNFERANGSSAAGVSVDNEHQFVGNVVGSVATTRHGDLFNPRAVHQSLRLVSQAQSSAADVSHISSNGYYGFSYVNAPLELNNNNDDNNNNNNNNICNFNNLNTAPMRKKRIFVKDDDLFANIAGYPNPTAVSTVAAIDRCDDHGQVAAAKRCRYDDDFTEQYFVDFFNMQAADAAAAPTQIGTQSCLMDTEDCNQQHLQEEQLMQQQQQQQQHQITQQQTTLNATSIQPPQ